MGIFLFFFFCFFEDTVLVRGFAYIYIKCREIDDVSYSTWVVTFHVNLVELLHGPPTCKVLYRNGRRSFLSHSLSLLPFLKETRAMIVNGKSRRPWAPTPFCSLVSSLFHHFFLIQSHFPKDSKI